MWFRRKPKPDSSEASRELRHQALTVAASDLGLAPTAARPNVWGILMETAYPEGVATLVVLADGTTSLYFSGGGGVIGAGDHDSVRGAGEMVLSATEAHLSHFVTAGETPLPDVGRVRFYVRTFDGIKGAEADEEDLGEGRHPLSPVFHAAHDVIGAIRQVSP